MQCQECQQRPATIRFQQIVNGEKQEVHVCEVCAQEMGNIKAMHDNYSLQDLLTGLFNIDTSQLGSKSIQEKQMRKEAQCPKCEMTFEEFRQVGKFGCASCYDTFSEQIVPILKRVHSGNTEHTGKIPKRSGDSIKLKKKVEAYRKEMQRFVEQEAFEEAAAIRDKIKVLEGKAKGANEE
ncbi:UvrB/UvrC motif-containing protein [Oceanobacillus sp. CAU 1775]